MFDVVDLLTKLKREFPHVEFVIDEEKNRGVVYQKFKLTKLFDQRFERPIPTSISIRKDSTINEKEFDVIRRNMWESFAQHKLMGLI